jgi:hypothetical protein
MLLIGSTRGRRTELLREALAARRLHLEVFEWGDLLAKPGAFETLEQRAREGGHAWCKIETPGEEVELDHALVLRGWKLSDADGPPPRPAGHGELEHRRWRFAGFTEALREIARRVRGPRLLNEVDDILGMCDKWACQQHLRAQGVPIAEPLAEVDSFEEFDACFPARDYPAVFIKPRYGSSAAGVIALRRHHDGRVLAYSPARLTAGAIHNHLGVSRYSRRAEITALVDAVARQGAYAECWSPKARLPGDRHSHYDLRIVATCGEPRQRVARISRSPLTNLHLGNSRAAPEWLSDIELRTLEDTTTRAAAVFARSHTIGFDIGFNAGRACVFEANAFGDLLPGLRFAGLTTYEDQARMVSRDE